MTSTVLDWFLSNGGKLHSVVDIHHNASDGRGYRLQTTGRNLTQEHNLGEEVIVSLPYALCFSLLQIPVIAPWWPTAWIDQHNSTILTRFLLIEAYLLDKGESFAHYIGCLPQPDDDPPFHTPLYWTPDELACLKGSNLHQAAILREKQWKDEFETGKTALLGLCPTRAPNLERWTFDLYKWAATVLTTRCFPGRLVTPLEGHASTVAADLKSNFATSKTYEQWIEKRSEYAYPVLLPLLDFANHSPTAKVTWHSTGSHVELISTVPRNHSQEIFNNYGQKSNEELILGYGFDIPQNPANHVGLALHLGGSAKMNMICDARREAKGDSDSTLMPALVTAFPASGSSIYALRAGVHPLSSSAAGPLAILAMNSRELVQQCKNPFGTPVFAGDRFPSHLSVACGSQFYAKLWDDRSKIALWDLRARRSTEEPASGNMQVALRYRESQLEILDGAISLCGKTLEAWKRTGRVLCLEDILTGFLPSEMLKQYRQIVHRVLGTRNADKIIMKGLDELAFALWFLVIFKNLESSSNDTGEAISDGSVTIRQLRIYANKLVEGYGLPPSAEGYIQPANLADAEASCLDHKLKSRIDQASTRYEQMVRDSDILESQDLNQFSICTKEQTFKVNLHQMLRWAVRVFAEEWISLGVGSMDPSHEPADSDEAELMESFIVFEDDEDDMS